MGEQRKTGKLRDLLIFLLIDAVVILASFVAYRAGLIGQDALAFVAIIFLSGTVGTALAAVFHPSSSS